MAESRIASYRRCRGISPGTGARSSLRTMRRSPRARYWSSIERYASRSAAIWCVTCAMPMWDANCSGALAAAWSPMKLPQECPIRWTRSTRSGRTGAARRRACRRWTARRSSSPGGCRVGTTTRNRAAPTRRRCRPRASGWGIGRSASTAASPARHARRSLVQTVDRDADPGRARRSGRHCGSTLRMVATGPARAARARSPGLGRPPGDRGVERRVDRRPALPQPVPPLALRGARPHEPPRRNPRRLGVRRAHWTSRLDGHPNRGGRFTRGSGAVDHRRAGGR